MTSGRITSVSNQRLKAALRLRGRRERDRDGLTLIDGVRETMRAMSGGAVLREAFVVPELCLEPECRALLERLREHSVPLVELGREAFERLAYGDRVDGVVAVAVTPQGSLNDLRLPAEPLVAVVEGVEKPGNLGAILRSADGAGVSAVVVADSAGDLFNPNVIRASIATVFSVPVAVGSTADVLDWLRRRSLRIVATRVDAPAEYFDVDLTGPVAIALGSEAHGLSDAWGELTTASVRVPMLGVGDSLNVSATAAILFYEALRQRAAATRRGRT
ncbi:MAG TPA: TrmH family RNA methyltransferase [Candidatus Caenarcaniphilales bacterium]|nr:TrmH family RNA methyltransferase [Candidatus Caenarcaniphilales bacterium]